MSEPGDRAARAVADEAALVAYAEDLRAAVAEALGPWVRAGVTAQATVWGGADFAHRLGEAAATAARKAEEEVLPLLAQLLAEDVERQRTTPLTLLRRAASHLTAVLETAGVPPPRRDAGAERAAPRDLYDMGPFAFADLGEAVGDAGLRWGAAKAHVIKQRRAAATERGRP